VTSYFYNDTSGKTRWRSCPPHPPNWLTTECTENDVQTYDVQKQILLYKEGEFKNALVNLILTNDGVHTDELLPGLKLNFYMAKH